MKNNQNRIYFHQFKKLVVLLAAMPFYAIKIISTRFYFDDCYHQPSYLRVCLNYLKFSYNYQMYSCDVKYKKWNK